MSSPTDCLAIIPARDEAATVGAIVAETRAALGCEVLVVNDASQDDTAEQAAAAGATVLTLPIGLGAWGATQTGLRYAVRQGFRGAITLDADGQHHPESLPALFAARNQSGADVVIGTCIGRLSKAKRIAWLYLRLLTGLPLSDFTSGLRFYGSNALQILASPQASLLDYQDVGVLMLLARKKLTVAETPVPMSPRYNGGSRVFSSWLTVARYMLHTTILCFAQIDAGRRNGNMRQ